MSFCSPRGLTFTWWGCCGLFEACDCLKRLSIHFDLCVDATGVVCHQLGLLDTDLHAVGCGETQCLLCLLSTDAIQ